MAVTRLDEYLIHQLPTTIDHVADSDPRWYDRYWFSIFDIDREIVVSAGIGVYPNNNVIDGFSIVVHDGVQYNVRGSRELNHERMDVTVGPLSVEVIEGLKLLRLRLGENEHGVTYDLTLETTFPGYQRPAVGFARANNRVMYHSEMGMFCGRVSGRVQVRGRTFEVDPERWMFSRDRSWGMRFDVGAPEAGATGLSRAVQRDADGRSPWAPTLPFIAAQFPDRFIFMLGEAGEVIYRRGDHRERVRITSAEHEVDIHPGTIKPKRVTTVFTDARGEQTTITSTPWATAYLKGGNYGGYQGRYHGQHHDGGYLIADTFPVREMSVMNDIAERDDHICEFRIGDEVGYGSLLIGTRAGNEPYQLYRPSARE